MTKKKYRVIRVPLKWYHFAVRYMVLVVAVSVGWVVLEVTKHNWLYAAGTARAIELAGEAGADSLTEEMEDEA